MNSPYDIETIKLIDGKISHKRNVHPFNEFNYNCISILINLNNIKPLKIFKWLKKNNIKDKEMLKTFNCGVGFCLIIKPKNQKKITNYFPKNFKPYLIGRIVKKPYKVKLNGKINWK